MPAKEIKPKKKINFGDIRNSTRKSQIQKQIRDDFGGDLLDASLETGSSQSVVYSSPDLENGSEPVVANQFAAADATSQNSKPSIDQIWSPGHPGAFGSAFNLGKAQKQINFIRFEHRVYAKFTGLKRVRVSRQLGVFVTIAFAALIILQGVRIYASGQNAKTLVLGATTEGISHLEQAASLVQQQQFTDSQQQFAQAQQNFEKAQDNINSLGIVLDSILTLMPSAQKAQKLLDAGVALSRGGQDITNFYNSIQQIHYGPTGIDAPGGFASAVHYAQGYLQKGNADLAEADSDLNAVDLSSLPTTFQQKFTSYKQQLDQATAGLNQVNQLLGLAADFVGNGQKTVLVLFENNREMRATGGFIGTYGFFRLNNGKIISQQISSIYDLDGQLKQKIAAPGAMHDLTDRWYLRDSNWFADFEKSAQKASDFYEQEGMETPDAVIALTPDMIVDLLKVTGPIDMPKYGVTLTADNFRDQIQLNTSIIYDRKENAPKQMLSDFAPLLLQKLMALPQQSYAGLASALLDNLQQKNILLYDRNPQVQNQFEDYNWAGQVQSTNGDYLEVLNTNLGGRKTDQDVTEQISMKSVVQDDGGVIDTITYSRSHTPSLLEPGSKNIDYVRFLVPAGSKLISATGFTPHPFYLSDGSAFAANPSDPRPYIVDPDLAAMDNASSIDRETGTVLTTESDKTEFANWIETNPGETSTVTLSYRLPMDLHGNGKYSLLVQKQPGNTANFSYAFDPGKMQIIWNSGDLGYNQILKSDIFIGAVLSSK